MSELDEAKQIISDLVNDLANESQFDLDSVTDALAFLNQSPVNLKMISLNEIVYALKNTLGLQLEVLDTFINRDHAKISATQAKTIVTELLRSEKVFLTDGYFQTSPNPDVDWTMVASFLNHNYAN